MSNTDSSQNCEYGPEAPVENTSVQVLHQWHWIYSKSNKWMILSDKIILRNEISTDISFSILTSFSIHVLLTFRYKLLLNKNNPFYTWRTRRSCTQGDLIQIEKQSNVYIIFKMRRLNSHLQNLIVNVYFKYEACVDSWK